MTSHLRQIAEVGRIHGFEGASVAPAHLEAMETRRGPVSFDAQPSVLAEDMRTAEIGEHHVLFLVEELGVVHRALRRARSFSLKKAAAGSASPAPSPATRS